MKNNLESRSAFSLIELSIVILIIGILIAGVTQGSRIIAASRLNNAKTLTQSSPVASVNDLSLWIETTADESFDDVATEDNAVITNWYDNNPQTSAKSSFTQATTANKPLYSTDSAGNISSLPTIEFVDDTDFMTAAAFSNVKSNAVTAFMVLKTPSTITAGLPIFGKRANSGDDTSVNIAVNMGSTTTGWQFCDQTSCLAPASGASIAASTPYVVSIVYTYTSSSTTSSATFYKNGTIINAAATNSASLGPYTSSSGPLFIGKKGISCSNFFW